MNDLSPDANHLARIASLAARGFASTEEATQALLEVVATQMGMRSSLLMEITPSTGSNFVRAAFNLPGGCDIAPESDLPLEDTF